MSKSTILKQYQRALAQWPADTLRPDVSFSKMIQKRIESKPSSEAVSVSPAKEQDQVNALYTLLENRYMKKYSLSRRMLEPQSNPSYYKVLLKEIEEGPKRSWVQNQINKWKGSLRFK